MTKTLSTRVRLYLFVIPSEVKRSREWNGQGSRDMDGKTGGFANGK